MKDIQITCTKRDRFGIVNSTVVEGLNNSHKIVIRSRMNKLTTIYLTQISIDVSVVNLDDNDFGDYVCMLKCLLPTQLEFSYYRHRLFSIIKNDYRSHSITSHLCHESLTGVSSSYMYLFEHYQQLTKVTIPFYKDAIVDLQKFTGFLVLVCCVLAAILASIVCAKVFRVRKERKRRHDIALAGSLLKSASNSPDDSEMRYDVFLSYSS